MYSIYAILILMLKKVLLFSLLAFFLLIKTSPVFAEVGASGFCGKSNPGNPGEACIDGYSCQQTDPNTYICQEDTVGGIFGKITPPDAIKNFAGTDVTGTAGLNKFLSNLIALIYAVAAIVLVLMIVWGAWDWLLSGGEKEKVANAQRKIIHAIIGIVLFAGAFAIIQLLEVFTGFNFFEPPTPGP